MKKEKLRTTPQKHKGPLRDDYKQLYTNKMDNLEEMDKFLERYYLPRLNQEERENRNKTETLNVKRMLVITAMLYLVPLLFVFRMN